jgi:Tfp pilus assembly protein PilZ
MFFKNLFKNNSKENGSSRGIFSSKTPRDQEHVALLQISSAIKSQKDITAIFEIIGRESARCLKASRATLFLGDASKGALKVQFTYSPDPAEEKIGLLEEKDFSRRILTDKRPILLKDSKDFAEFGKSDDRERKTTSFMSVPFGFQGKVAGALSLSMFNGKKGFSQRDLEFLAIFANHVSIAMQNQYLLEEVRKAGSLRKNYEQHLDDLMSQLQGLSSEERKRIDDHIVKLLSGFKDDRRQPIRPEEEEDTGRGKGSIRLAGEMTFEEAPNLTEKVQVEIEAGSLRGTGDLSRAAIFIPTANPRDLGEQFLLKIYLAEGRQLNLPSKVIFTNKYGKESQNLRRGMEIKFLDLSPELEKQVGDYLQTLPFSPDREGQEPSKSLR